MSHTSVHLSQPQLSFMYSVTLSHSSILFQPLSSPSVHPKHLSPSSSTFSFCCSFSSPCPKDKVLPIKMTSADVVALNILNPVCPSADAVLRVSTRGKSGPAAELLNEARCSPGKTTQPNPVTETFFLRKPHTYIDTYTLTHTRCTQTHKMHTNTHAHTLI